MYPHLGTVTYLTSLGGPTIVLDHVGSPNTNISSCIDNVSNVWLSEPREFKHFIFDGRFLHGASDSIFEGDEVSRENENDSSRRRVTFLVNIWLNHIPIESKPLPSSVVRKLQLPLNLLNARLLDDDKLLRGIKAIDMKNISIDRHVQWNFMCGNGKHVLRIPLPSSKDLRTELSESDTLVIEYDGARGAPSVSKNIKKRKKN